MHGGDWWFGRAQETLKSAEALKVQGRDWPNVYYMAGLAVEHTLWAVRCRRAGLSEPDHDAVPGHNLARILEHVGLKDDLRVKVRASRPFGKNWLTVKDWSSNRRFERVSRNDGLDMLLATANPTHGVMVWLREIYQTLP